MSHIRKACLTILVASLLPLAVLADQNIEWIPSFSGSEYGDIQDLIKTSDDGSIVYGSTGSNPSERQLWLVKLDVNNDIEWENTYGGNGFETAWSMALTRDGGYILAGSQGTSEVPIEDGIAVYKVSSTGEQEWAHLMSYSFTLGPPLIYERVDGGIALFFAATDHEGYQGIQPRFIEQDGSPGNMASLIEAHLGSGDIADVKFTVRESSDGGYVLRVPIKWGWLPLGWRSFRIPPSAF